MHPTAVSVPSPYYFYSQEVESQRQSQYPVMAELPSYQHSLPVYQQQPLQPQPIYTAAQPPMNMHQFNPKLHPQFTMTPIASPRPTHLKPTLIVQQDSPLLPLNTQFGNTDLYGLPSTPPLSSSGSTASSPPSSCGMLQTPINGSFFFEKVEGVKAGCEVEVHSELLAAVDWTHSASPPMTPGE